MFRVKETLKNILIVVLLLSAVTLMLLALPTSIVRQLSLPEHLADALGVGKEETFATTETRFTTAATPILISTNHDGGRHTATRDEAALTAAYDVLSSCLGQALTTAQNAETISHADFLSALDDSGVLFSFAGEIPADALSLWLTGDSGTVSRSSGDYLVVREKNAVNLLILGESPTKFETSVSTSALLSALETFTPDGSVFAAEGTGLHPLTLWEQDVTLPNYSAESPVTGGFSMELATDLDFNPYGAGVYTDPEGSTIYSETDRTLTVSPVGAVTLTVTKPGLAKYTAPEDSAAAKIETARALLDTITRASLGDARLQLAGVTEDTLCFTYLLGGTPVLPAACTVRFTGKSLTELTVSLRSYHVSTGVSRLMPLTAAASLAPENTRLTPAYSLTAECGWAEK